MSHSNEFSAEVTFLAHYKNHLEFLGYQILNEVENRIWAKHAVISLSKFERTI